MPKVIDVNGISVEISDQAAQAFDALKASHATVVAAKDAEIATSNSRTKDLETQLAKSEAKTEAAEKGLKDAEAKLTPEALDTAARERATLLEDARILAPKLDMKALDAISIQRESLKAAGVALDGKSDDYIAAAFDARVAIVKEKGGTAAKGADSLANRHETNDSGDARTAWIKRQANAYKREARS